MVSAFRELKQESRRKCRGWPGLLCGVCGGLISSISYLKVLGGSDFFTGFVYTCELLSYYIQL